MEWFERRGCCGADERHGAIGAERGISSRQVGGRSRRAIGRRAEDGTARVSVDCKSVRMRIRRWARWARQEGVEFLGGDALKKRNSRDVEGYGTSTKA